MSLARNPNMPYAVAGRQTQPFERMHVHSNVRVPAAEASVDYDGRMSYSAPNSVRRRREYAGVPMRAAAALVVIAVFILSIFYLSAVSNRSAVYRACKRKLRNCRWRWRGRAIHPPSAIRRRSGWAWYPARA